MLGENLKKAFLEARIGHQEAADRMGISKANLYNLFKKDSFEFDYLRRASEITGVPINYFFSEQSNKLDKDDPLAVYNNGQSTSRISKGIEDIKLLFEEELRVKNQQIANLQEMLKMVLGKSKGAIEEPTLTPMQQFDKVMTKYKTLTADQFGFDPTILTAESLYLAAAEQKSVAPHSQYLRIRR